MSLLSVQAQNKSFKGLINDSLDWIIQKGQEFGIR